MGCGPELGPRAGPSTLVGVDVLGYTDQLVEIEAVAVIGTSDVHVPGQ